jgi:hypothetical protein
MNDILDGRDTVLFLGAGFSVESGFPAIRNFGSFCKDEHKALKKHAEPKDEFRNAGPMLIESFKVFELFQNYCRRSGIMTEENIQNMEHIFTVAEILKESGISQIKLNGSLYDIQELISHIQLTLWKIYQRCPLVRKKDPGTIPDIKNEVYEPFFNNIKKRANSLTIITTNYDLNIEYMTFALNDSQPCCVATYFRRYEKC